MTRPTAVPANNDQIRHEITARLGTIALRDVPLQELLEHAVHCLHAGVDARFVKVLEYRSAADDLLVRAGLGWDDGVVGVATLPADLRSPPGRAYRTRAPVSIRDLREQDEFEWSPLLRGHGVVSVVNVPIANDHFAFGVLEADATAPQAWSEGDLHFLFALAHLLTAAIQRRRAEEQRELLFRELQHRVKNNLQLIAALVRLHGRKAGDPKSRESFTELAQRVAVIGSLYQMLATSRRIDRVNIRAYLAALCAKLELLAPGDAPVHVEGAFDDRAILVDDAIPLGLIVNELVTNSIKHAFGASGGVVRVELRLDAAGAIATLVVADDGGGMAPDARPDLGLQIVQLLVRQLAGTLRRPPAPQGTVFELRLQLGRSGRLERSGLAEGPDSPGA